jgi:hypothetical protein
MNERTRSRPSRADRPAQPIGRYLRADALAIVIAIAAVLVIGVFLLDGPARISRLTVANPTDYDVSVELAPTTDGGWLPLAVLGQRSTRDLRDVIDQGDTWVFHFRAQGQDAGDVTIARGDLAAAGWKVTVPASVTTQLQALGVPSSPCVSAGCPARAG